jgi:hypothetical protein
MKALRAGLDFLILMAVVVGMIILLGLFFTYLKSGGQYGVVPLPYVQYRPVEIPSLFPAWPGQV